MNIKFIFASTLFSGSNPACKPFWQQATWYACIDRETPAIEFCHICSNSGNAINFDRWLELKERHIIIVNCNGGWQTPKPKELKIKSTTIAPDYTFPADPYKVNISRWPGGAHWYLTGEGITREFVDIKFTTFQAAYRAALTLVKKDEIGVRGECISMKEGD